MDTSLANADIELYFSAQADGYGLVESPGSDSVVNSTPAEDYQVERAIYYNNTGLASYVSDSGWSTLTTNAESYAAAKARVEDYIRGGTYGKLPCTFAIVRTEELKYVGLLDTYTGAAAAYSLRWLNTDYAGAAIRVRRASDNAEQDIGFTPSGDLDTTALATFCSGTDGFVKTWYSQTGSNDATQTTTSAQPKIYDSSTGVVTEGTAGNEKPALQFDGSNDHFTKAFTLDNPVSHFVVAQTSFSYDFIIDGYGAAYRNALVSPSTNNIKLENGTNITQSYTYGTQSLFSSVSKGAGSLLAVNGSSVTGTLGTSAMNGVTLGAPGNLASGFYMDGTIQEVIVYGSDQSSNRTGIESNINTYYSIY